MSKKADILPKSATNMIGEAVSEGVLQKKGKYIPVKKRGKYSGSMLREEDHDGRWIRLHPNCPRYYLDGELTCPSHTSVNAVG
jgi:hypothetical protein